MELFKFSEMVEKLQKILEENNFTPAESKVYLTLTKLGESKSGGVIKETSLQSSVVHNSLNTLSEKGFVKYVVKNKIKHYRAADLNVIRESLDARKKKFENSIPDFEALKTEVVEDFKVEVFEDFSGLLSCHRELIEDSQTGDVLKIFLDRANFSSKEVFDFYNEIERLNEDKGVALKKLSNIENKEFVKKYSITKIKLVGQKMPLAINIFRDKVVLLSFENTPRAILINNKEYAKQYHKLFNEIWG